MLFPLTVLAASLLLSVFQGRLVSATIAVKLVVAGVGARIFHRGLQKSAAALPPPLAVKHPPAHQECCACFLDAENGRDLAFGFLAANRHTARAAAVAVEAGGAACPAYIGANVAGACCNCSPSRSVKMPLLVNACTWVRRLTLIVQLTVAYLGSRASAEAAAAVAVAACAVGIHSRVVALVAAGIRRVDVGT